MNLEDLGLIAEITAAIATLLTLVYLAVQIRQNAAATRASVRQSIADQQLNYLHLRSSDPVIRPALVKMVSHQKLSPDDVITMRLHAIAGIRLFESHHAQYQMGTLSNEDWRALCESQKVHFGFTPVQEAFTLMRQSLNRDFAEFVTDYMEKEGVHLT
jgi:hypothetical protein